jgi:tetratricopeptide (TPR) repeat protein
MMNDCLSIAVENDILEPFDDRVDILFRELELATKWQRPSVLLAVYNSEYVRSDADIALENRLQSLGQSAYHIKVKNPDNADISSQISGLSHLNNVVFFVEGLRWGFCQGDRCVYFNLNEHREFFIDNRVRVVFWLTEKEAIDLAHFAPDYWSFRHRVVEFVDSPKPDQMAPEVLQSALHGMGDLTGTSEDLDAKIALRSALLTDLPAGNESTAARANLLLTLGMLHWRRGDYERASQFLNNALDLAATLEDNSFEALCFNAIALVQTALGRVDEAIQAYKNAIELSPQQVSVWNNLGHLYRKLNRHEEALGAFQKAIEQNDSDAQAWNGLGNLYQETGKNDDAIYAYLKAVDFSPDHAPSWSSLGTIYLDNGQLEDALAAFEKAVDIDPIATNTWLGLAKIYQQQGDDEKAGMAYQNVIEQDPGNTMAWNELGDLYKNAGAFDEAIHSYQQALNSNPECSLAYSNLASVHSLNGRLAEALPLLKKAIEHSNGAKAAAEIWNRLGDVYRQMNDPENAITAYRTADGLDPESAPHQGESTAGGGDVPSAPSEDESAPDGYEPIPPVEEPQKAKSTGFVLTNSLDGAPVTLNTLAPTDPQGVEATTWFEGLASVLPARSRIETSGTSGAIRSKARHAMEENGRVVELVPELLEAGEDDGLEIYYQSYDDIEPLTLLGREICFANIPSSDSPKQEPLASANTGEEETTIASQVPAEVVSEPANPEPSGLEESAAPVEDKPESPASLATGPAIEPMQSSVLEEIETSAQDQASLNEKNAQIWNELGNIYFNTGAYEEATHAFEMALELDPSYGWSYNNLASIYVQKKRYADAIPLFQKGLQFLEDIKDKAMLWNRMGDALRHINEHNQAAAAYRKALELDPGNGLLSRARISLLANHRA